jgi:hypothetical protein
MAKKLPSRPNLDQLKTQAKDLLKEYKAANGEAFARIRRHLPRRGAAPDAEMAAVRFVLQDAGLSSLMPRMTAWSMSWRKMLRRFLTVLSA